MVYSYYASLFLLTMFSTNLVVLFFYTFVFLRFMDIFIKISFCCVCVFIILRLKDKTICI